MRVIRIIDKDDIRREQMLEHVFRWFGGVILCLFALLPAWLLVHGGMDFIGHPHPLSQEDVVPTMIGLFILWFLLLLAYRAFAGRGRRKDDGLLPPLVMSGFFVGFFLLAIAMSTFGLMRHGPLGVFEGVPALIIGFGAVLANRIARRRLAKTGGVPGRVD